MKIVSKILPLGQIPEMPEHKGDNLYMHPLDLSASLVLPESFERWYEYIQNILEFLPNNEGIGFLTIDQKIIEGGQTHRRGGAHTDGNYFLETNNWVIPNPSTPKWIQPEPKPKWKQYWSQAKWSKYSIATGGALIISDYTACKAWDGIFDGVPGDGGDCEHLKPQLDHADPILMEPNELYWMNSTGIHESIPLEQTVKRSLVRLTLPADAPPLIF